jgi:hypothetical protein
MHRLRLRQIAAETALPVTSKADMERGVPLLIHAKGARAAMFRILVTAIGVVLFLVFVTPFAIGAYHRYEVAQRLKPLMTDNERAAFDDWMKHDGDAVAFGRSLYERCQLAHGPDSPDCAPYKAAIR